MIKYKNLITANIESHNEMNYFLKLMVANN